MTAPPVREKRARRRARVTPEDSLALRGAVLGAVVTGTLALAAAGAVSPGGATLVVALLVAGYWFSYVFRGETSWKWMAKVVLALGAVLAVGDFAGEVRAIRTLDEARFPLAELFLMVQVIHGFDLPARKDLNFSLGSSLALMAIAGTLAQDMAFAFFLVVYFGFVMAALTSSHRSELGGGAVAWMTAGEGRARFPWRDLGRAVGPVQLCGALIFMVLPQSVAAQYFSLPFSLGAGLGSDAGGGIMNPGGSGSGSSGTGYAGFDDRMDLSNRGDLSDDLVMRVRSSAPAMWKGIVFGHYDGRGWEGAPEDAPVLFGESPPYEYPPQFRSLGPRAKITQTYYVEVEQPNVIFAAGQPDTIWYEGGVTIDALGGVRTPSTLTPGTVYSVVSTRGSASVQELRSLPQEAPPDAIQPYLQLPSSLPERVRRLARDVTASARTDVDRVLAIEDYLRANYEYSTDSPVPPLERDAVDHFLYDADVGYCEQFASATAVMLRSLGIPARVVAGYAVGRRNTFSGYYEVRASDAHAWVEVWFPRYGWYEFDPTFAIPPAEAGLDSSVPLLGAIEALRKALAGAGPAAKAAVAAAAAVGLAVLAWIGWGRFPRYGWYEFDPTFAIPPAEAGLDSSVPLLGAIEALRKALAGAGPAAKAAVAAAAAVGLAVLVWIGWGRLPRRVRRSRGAGLGGAGPVTLAFRRFEDALAARGEARAPAETAAEVVARTARFHGDASRAALRVFEEERYGPLPPRDEDVAVAVEELERLARVARETP